MPEFNTQAEVDAHNVTVAIQREAVARHRRWQGLVLASAHDLDETFPLATLAPTGVLAPSGRRYSYYENLLIANSEGYNGHVTIFPSDRAVASSVLCPPDVWLRAINGCLGWRPILGFDSGRVISAAQKILDGDK